MYKTHVLISLVSLMISRKGEKIANQPLINEESVNEPGKAGLACVRQNGNK